MELFMFIQTVSAFAAAHWTSLSTVSASFGAFFLLLQSKAYSKALTLAVVTASEVAKLELSDSDKRKKIEDAVYTGVPLLAKLMSKSELESVIDHAIALLK